MVELSCEYLFVLICTVLEGWKLKSKPATVININSFTRICQRFCYIMNKLAGCFCDFQGSATFQNTSQYLFWTNRVIQQILNAMERRLCELFYSLMKNLNKTAWTSLLGDIIICLTLNVIFLRDFASRYLGLRVLELKLNLELFWFHYSAY